MENDDYKPVEPNYYNYKGKNILSGEFQNNIMDYKSVNLCCYSIDNNHKFPFIRYLLRESFIDGTLNFPLIPVFKNFDANEFINFSKVGLFGLLMSDDFETFNNNVEFVGFYEFNNNLYVFFDITKCNLDMIIDDNNGPLWLALLDEIINYRNTCNISIESSVTDFFTINDEFCFLNDENNNSYEIPIVGYVEKPENKLKFTYMFGETKSNKNNILGPYYYFTEYNNLLKKKIICGYKKVCLVRFALFIGITKYIENHPNDPIDDSEIKRERLQDSKLNQNLENLTIRISDHDGKWAEKYDSACIKNIELDNGQLFDDVIIVIKEYEQQVPLSCHYI
jgi:hypothetical protein